MITGYKTRIKGKGMLVFHPCVGLGLEMAFWLQTEGGQNCSHHSGTML